MPSLKDLRLRIASVKSTRKITSAMKMVAASKLRRAQTAAESARPFAERMERMLGTLAASVAGQAGAPRPTCPRLQHASRTFRAHTRFRLHAKSIARALKSNGYRP